MNFWKELDRPIKVLAPMAGYTDAAFRLLCRENGADVVVSELISADAIAYGKFQVSSVRFQVNEKELIFNKVFATKNQPTADLLSFFEAERPFVVQLFGKNPVNFGKAAKWITQELKPDGIDINMGCPARKVVNSDHGAALLKNPDLACEIVRAVKDNTDLPVSVKTRLGWDDDDQILEFAPALKNAGINAILIHGRTYKDAFKGKARWENIFEVKKMMVDDLIVIGNGDISSIFNFQFSVFNKGKVELDGAAIGRATFGKPWIFSKDEATFDELKNIILRHAELVFAAKGEYGLVEFRKHLLSYLKGFPNAKEMRKEAVSVVTIDQVKELIKTLGV